MSSAVRRRISVVESSSENRTRNASERRLYFYQELDLWQQDNHYIRSGYVKETLSFRECFKSLLYLHNETVNIYTHLFPSSIILVTITYYINNNLTIYENYLGVWEKLNFFQFGLAATFCLFMSSTFHCIKAHSHKISKFGNRLDYFGIIILITCSLISIILFAFYDEQFWKITFIGVFLIFGSICTFLTLDSKFSTNVYRPLRTLMFILFGLSGVLPILVAINLYGFETAVERSSSKWLVLEGFFYIFGAVLYAVRVPERFSHVEEDEASLLGSSRVGKFDIFGHSHQIFHIMVVIAAFCHWKALVNCYHYLHQVILVSAI